MPRALAVLPRKWWSDAHQYCWMDSLGFLIQGDLMLWHHVTEIPGSLTIYESGFVMICVYHIIYGMTLYYIYLIIFDSICLYLSYSVCLQPCSIYKCVFVLVIRDVFNAQMISNDKRRVATTPTGLALLRVTRDTPAGQRDLWIFARSFSSEDLSWTSSWSWEWMGKVARNRSFL